MDSFVNMLSIVGLLLLVLWGVMALGIVWPSLGRRLLKPLWPGQFDDPHIRQSATRYWIAMLSGQAFIALNIILNQFQLWQPSSAILWYALRLLTIVMALFCFVQANRFHQQLPQVFRRSSFLHNDVLVLALGFILSSIVLLAGITLFPFLGMSQRAASLVTIGLSVGCFLMSLVYMLRKRRKTQA